MAYDPDLDTVVIVHGVAKVSGVATDFYFCDRRGIVTGPADTPANTSIPGVVISAGSWDQDLFGGNDFTGLSRPGGTTIVLNNSDGALDGFLFDYPISGLPWRVYIGNRGVAFPDDFVEIYRAYGVTAQASNAEQVQIVLRDASDSLDRPVVTATFAGTGGLEGTTVVPGNKQLAIGEPGFIPVRLIDVDRQIYFVCEGGTGGLQDTRLLEPSGTGIYIWDTYIGGDRWTRGNNYTSAAQMISTAPSANEVRFFFGDEHPTVSGHYLGPIYMRLGSEPTFDVRVYAETYNYAGSLWKYTDLVERAGIDVSESYSTAERIYGLLIDDDRTYLQAMSDSARITLAYYGFDRLGAFFSGTLREPEAADTTVYLKTPTGVTRVTRPLRTFTTDNTDRDSWRIAAVPGFPAPAHKLTVSAGAAWPCECSDTAPARIREYLTRSVWSVFSGSNPEIKEEHAGAVSISLSTEDRYFSNSLDQSTFVHRFLALHGGFRKILYLDTNRITAEDLAVYLGDNVVADRDALGCDGGRAFIAVSKRIDIDRRRITFGLWGGEAGPGGYLDTGSGGAPPVVNLEATRNLVPSPTIFGFGTVEVLGRGEVIVDDPVIEGLGEIFADPMIGDVALLLQGGADTSTTLQDLSPTYGDSVSIAGGAAWTSSQQVDGENMIAATQILPDIPGFTSSGADSRFSRASGQPISIEFCIRWNSLPNTDPSGVGFAWSGPSGNLVTLKLKTNTGNLALLNGSTNVGTIAALSADTTYKVHAGLTSGNDLFVDVDGTEVYIDAGSSTNSAGTYTFIPFATGTANATAATWWGGPLRFTRNARDRGVAFDLPFPES